MVLSEFTVSWAFLSRSGQLGGLTGCLHRDTVSLSEASARLRPLTAAACWEMALAYVVMAALYLVPHVVSFWWARVTICVSEGSVVFSFAFAASRALVAAAIFCCACASNCGQFGGFCAVTCAAGRVKSKEASTLLGRAGRDMIGVVCMTVEVEMTALLAMKVARGGRTCVGVLSAVRHTTDIISPR